MNQNKTVSQWLRTGKEMLEAAGRENPRMDAELLLEKIRHVPESQSQVERLIAPRLIMGNSCRPR